MSINDSILTENFDDQLKLVEKSLSGDSQFEKKSSSVKKPKKVQAFTNASRKFKFTEIEDETSDKDPKSTSPPPNVNCIMPPPINLENYPKIDTEDEARASMLMSWYMAGYHTGYFEAMRKFKK